MKSNTLEHAISEAERFLHHARILSRTQYMEKFAPIEGETMPGKLSAQVKRSSMDLTRALANLRQDRLPNGRDR